MILYLIQDKSRHSTNIRSELKDTEIKNYISFFQIRILTQLFKISKVVYLQKLNLVFLILFVAKNSIFSN